MALNPYYPQNFYGANPYVMPQQAPVQMQPQRGGFVRVQNEAEARTYPVAPGMSVTFINENAPYCYTKTMDFSQLDRPRFEKYRLVKEEDAAQVEEQVETDHAFATMEDVAAVKMQVDELTEKVLRLSERRQAKMREAHGDE